jgi:hypothetical protein
MANPWLKVTLEDYEGHMNSAEVQQLGVLSELFAEVLALRRPSSVAVLGIAGGNGLEHIDSNLTKRVVGLDVNPLYLEIVSRRYPFVSALELACVDLAEEVVRSKPVALVHAALVFEHAGVGRCLDNAVSLVAPEGALSVVLQLPSEIEQGVSRTPFYSIQNLKSDFRFVDPAKLRETLEQRGFRLMRETRRSLPAGKSFWMGIFGQKL